MLAPMETWAHMYDEWRQMRRAVHQFAADEAALRMEPRR
jgi:hypothetical protein